mmetsp:Transcript_11304/g.32644  ORF Transcript_11304/g.32644 Transcript_11304/m.32644 type:complete len:234 (-) Transcript_11304:946-1647(-)
MKPVAFHATRHVPTQRRAISSANSALPGAPLASRPSMSMDCKGGHALGASHCCPEAMDVVARPPGPKRPQSAKEPTIAEAWHSSAKRAHSGTAKSASVAARAPPCADAATSAGQGPGPPSGSQRSTQRSLRQKSVSKAWRRWVAASEKAAAVGSSYVAPGGATARNFPPVATASAMAASVRSKLYIMALRSTGSTLVTSDVRSSYPEEPAQPPARDHLAEKSQPVSATLANSR